MISFEVIYHIAALQAMLNDSSLTVKFLADPVIGHVLLHVYQRLSTMTEAGDHDDDVEDVDDFDDDIDGTM